MNKTILSLIILATAASQSLFAQTTTVTMSSNGTQSISVPSGQVFQMLMWDTNGSPSFRVDGRDLLGPGNAIVAGPKTVAVTTHSGYALSFTYKLTADTQTATANVASQAVVIPSTGITNADIIFESSPDLVTWTAAVAGNYAPTTPNRFFRVRLVTH